MDIFVKILHRLYPIVIGVVVSGFFYVLGIDYSMPDFEKVLDNTTVFSSIIIGFLGALLGILVSIKDVDIVEAIFESEEKNTLKAYFNETFLIGITVVIFSSVMQVMKSHESYATLILFHIWLMLSIWFLPSTYRIVSILMNVFFKTNSKNANIRPTDGEKISQEKNSEIKRRLSKSKT